MASVGAADKNVSHDKLNVEKSLLRGHRDAVSCLDTTGTANTALLLSGSADGTARVWDLRMQRAALCIVPKPNQPSKAEVTAVAFHPFETSSVSDAFFNSDLYYAWQHTVYLATSDCDVMKYDLRHANRSLIVKSPPTEDYTQRFQSRDEINQLALARDFFSSGRKKGENGIWIAAADDNGDVRLKFDPDNPDNPDNKISFGAVEQAESIDCAKAQNKDVNPLHCADTKPTDAQDACTVLRHAGASAEDTRSQKEVALVTSAVFNLGRVELEKREKYPLLLATGGTDCVVRLWDVKRPRNALASYCVPRLDDNANQVCNPPMIHSLSWSRGGNILAAGLGDGSCQILSVKRLDGKKKSTPLLKFQTRGRLDEGHTSAVACVHFPWKSNIESLSDSIDRLLLSAGNDGNILFWDLGRDVVGERATDPSALFPGLTLEEEEDNTFVGKVHIRTSKKKKRNKAKPSKSTSKAESTPRILFVIPHKEKPNCISTCGIVADVGTSHMIQPSLLFVADTTYNITKYNIPHR